ncbi:Helix-turn-helix domain protein OS=Tsukamurella paurometabola (strain ATCC 8368 / DSM / CCUG 35730 / CIP 100753 / JCM 10117 / KCTC 9821 / NBRC 16120 / NCIMB 702349 / NCTC 13040) OX=521096 GN=Tpau_0309 PE=4 SV=1 [Tsukamurella paurometabola]|uniref:Helix-turn-helix domain protein n=1 Tax=Tsukamurella paurometabola (strain ATCC 8368 / DSM 20162 / CCUG 35730 / CIP 100753 / JCM 10117 / KCTC 9821 / NBRC 16120 / NCIMB 702349 / NCTC 13040) TaxID=521096 RepID=D5URA2_TSUPD|nr:helix-turn-helix transcriptional regulator [Tsukamurella paurometabola]ADG76955.1 helix-turn-helix domain protein [Tsukamurella paurometabola DSM 20162]SUP42317.1 Uncharacterised protein [Tsukamurella paurometabola]
MAHVTDSGNSGNGIDAHERRREMGRFLKARRARGSLPAGKAMTRQQVAELVHVSIDYYTRIEQGRATPSASVTNQIFEVFKFNADERKYIKDLVDPGATLPPSEPSGFMHTFLAGVREVPAIIVGPHTSIHGWNAAANRIIVNFDEIPAAERTLARMIFGNANFRALFANIREYEILAAGVLRSTSAPSPACPKLVEEVEYLSSRYPTFKYLWARFTVSQPRGRRELTLVDNKGNEKCFELASFQNIDDRWYRILMLIRPGAT